MGQASSSGHKALSAGVVSLAVLITLLVMGLERAADGSFDGIVKHLQDNASRIDPWSMRANFFQRLACGYSGECGPCSDWLRRIGQIDCSGPRVYPTRLSPPLRTDSSHPFGVEEDDRSWLQRNREYWAWAPGIVFGLMSLPVALLFMLKELLNGGWLVSLVGLIALVLGISTSYKLTVKEGRGNLFAFIIFGFLAVTVYQLIFRWVVLGLLSALAHFLVFFTIIGGAVKAALSVVAWSFRIKELRSPKGSGSPGSTRAT